MSLVTERLMVREATPRILEALRLSQAQCTISHELAVGHSIADIVILRSTPKTQLPAGPLSVVESAILSSLRRLGAANPDEIANEAFMAVEPVRRALHGKLSSWELVRNQKGEFKTATAWVLRTEIIAIEAKLTRWRDAIEQAMAYKRYADRSFVLLPRPVAHVAAKYKNEFQEAGVGLLAYEDGKVMRVIQSPRERGHAWHREYAISRIK